MIVRLSRLCAGLLALAALAVAPLAFAAPTLAPPVFVWGAGDAENPGPVALVGQDALTALPCIVGQSATCALAAPIVASYAVSAANTALTAPLVLGAAHDTLSISAVCSAGTATLTVSASADGVHFLTIDSLAAAAAQAKVYVSGTLGATTAISPLSFPYVTVTAGACGSGDVATVSIAAK